VSTVASVATEDSISPAAASERPRGALFETFLFFVRAVMVVCGVTALAVTFAELQPRREVRRPMPALYQAAHAGDLIDVRLVDRVLRPPWRRADPVHEVWWTTKDGHDYRGRLDFSRDAIAEDPVSLRELRAQIAHQLPAGTPMPTTRRNHTMLAFLSLSIGGIVHIGSVVTGPRPQWLTRWGWFFLGGLPGLGMLLTGLFAWHPPALPARLHRGGDQGRRWVGGVVLAAVALLGTAAPVAYLKLSNTLNSPAPAGGNFLVPLENPVDFGPPPV
jgi:hypothetical protein